MRRAGVIVGSFLLRRSLLAGQKTLQIGAIGILAEHIDPRLKRFRVDPTLCISDLIG